MATWKKKVCFLMNRKEEEENQGGDQRPAIDRQDDNKEL